jgi:uncharacterized protein YaaR (DUF327 family)
MSRHAAKLAQASLNQKSGADYNRHIQTMTREERKELTYFKNMVKRYQKAVITVSYSVNAKSNSSNAGEIKKDTQCQQS